MKTLLRFTLFFVVLLCASCSSSLIYKDRMASNSNVVITHLDLFREDVWANLDVKVRDSRSPNKRVNAPKGYDLLVLKFGITNYSEEKVTIDLSKFLIKIKDKYYPPVDQNSWKKDVWKIGLGENSSKTTMDRITLNLVYLIQKDEHPSEIVLERFGTLDIPAKK
jgi:hypothetical protein